MPSSAIGARGRAVIPAADPDPARRGLIQPGDHPHRGRLAGPVRAHEAGHHAGPHDEIQPVDRQLLPVPPAKVLYLDHRYSVHRWRRQPRHPTHARNHPPGPASAERPQAEQATYAARPTRRRPTAYPAGPGRKPAPRRPAACLSTRKRSSKKRPAQRDHLSQPGTAPLELQQHGEQLVAAEPGPPRGQRHHERAGRLQQDIPAARYRRMAAHRALICCRRP